MRIDITTPYIERPQEAKVLEFQRVMPAKAVVSPHETEMNPHEKEGDPYTAQLIHFLEERKKRRKEVQVKASEKYKEAAVIMDLARNKKKGTKLDIKV